MSLMSCASGESIWRGYAYYMGNKVTHFERMSETEFKAQIIGNATHPYETAIDIAHPRRSSCNCPHAAGKRVICKHMVALFFCAFPDEAIKLHEKADAYEKEEEQRQARIERDLIKYVKSSEKKQLQQKLLELLYDGPEWLQDRFLRENLEN